MPIKIYQWGWVVVGVMLIAACSAVPVKKTEIIWPLPPDPPRIKFVRTIESAAEVEKKSFGKSLLEFLVGKEPLVHLQKPYAVHTDRNERVYIADSAWRKILIFDYRKKEFKFLGLDGPIDFEGCMWWTPRNIMSTFLIMMAS
ncbi:MAG: hypothetical protein HY200_04685 [Nitrospirae bacterium]|nr:hypothetical protein [Nitrospirota bacterium]